MNDVARLNNLDDLRLGCARQPEIFDQITRLASQMLDSPVALVSFIGADRQWVVGKTGIKIDEIPRDISICKHCVSTGETVNISDTLTDQRSRHTPLAHIGPGYRSYLGVPLRGTDDALIGALCVASCEPAKFTAEDNSNLAALARLAEQCIASHAKTLELHHADRSLNTINQQLWHAARHDRLTGLLNRAAFDERVTAALAAAQEMHVDASITDDLTRPRPAIMLLDLDHFNQINDLHGHDLGDLVLQKIAKRLEAIAGDGTVLARWGGDEFAFLFPSGQPLEAIRSLAAQLIADIAAHLTIGERTLSIRATCGIAQAALGTTSQELLRRADIALCHGKASGRAKVHCWDQSIEAELTSRRQAIATLAEALECGRDYAVFQPIIDICENRVVALETLFRIKDASGKELTASEILPGLLDPVLARQVTRCVMAEIEREGRTILETFGPDTTITLNLTEADLRSADLSTELQMMIAKGGLSPANLTLEITETTLLLDETGQIRRLLSELDALGFTIALDDFGTGFSSLAHLRDFPIGMLKIDRSFLNNFETNRQSRLIVQAVVEMGHSLGVKVVTEGVETDQQAAFLAEIGCRFAQGYRFCRPSALDQLRVDPSMNRSAQPVILSSNRLCA